MKRNWVQLLITLKYDIATAIMLLKEIPLVINNSDDEFDTHIEREKLRAEIEIYNKCIERQIDWFKYQIEQIIPEIVFRRFNTGTTSVTGLIPFDEFIENMKRGWKQCFDLEDRLE